MICMDITIPIPDTLTPSEENFLDKFLMAMYKINPSLHKNLSHMKRVRYPYMDIRLGCVL